MKYDITIIGSGIGGLTCALELARNGYSVCVIEKHNQPGGYAHSFKRAGFEFDVSLHHIGGLSKGKSIHGVLKTLGILDKIGFTKKKNILSVRFPDGEKTVPNRPGAFENFLINEFPQEKENIIALISHLKDLRWHIIGGWIDPDFDVPMEKLLTKDYLDKTFHELLTKFVHDEKLIAYLSQFWILIGLPPKLVNATFATCVFNSHFLEETYDIDGGGAALSKAFVSRMEELGSKVMLNSEVSKITVENGRATGVVLNNGTVINSEIVISNVDPYQTFTKLVAKEFTSDLFRFRLEKMEKSVSLYSLYLGLDCKPSELGVPDTTFFYNHSYEPLKGYANILKGNSESTDWCCTNYENSLINKAPKGNYVLTFVEVTPTADWLTLDKESYKIRKQEILNTLLNKYNKCFPGLKDHIKVMEFATPRTMNRYTSNCGGSVYGLAQTVEQSASKRLRNITPVENLFLTGAWTWSGGGYEGAIMSGIQTSASIKKKWGSKNDALPIKVKMDIGKPSSRTYNKFVRIYNKDVSAGGIADMNCFLRLMDRGRVDSGEELFNIAETESLFTHYNIQVYSITVKKHRDNFSGDKLNVTSRYFRRTSIRMVCHQQLINSVTGKETIDAIVELVQLDDNGKLIDIPAEINDPTDPPVICDISKYAVSLKKKSSHFFHKIRVYTEDTDLQGVTFHASYLRFCEETLFEFLDKVCRSTKNFTHWVYPEFNIRFFNSARVGEILDINLTADLTSDGRLVFFETMGIEGTDKIGVQICFDLELRNDKNEKVPFPAELREFIGRG
ncbi:MAG TPA: FAD-dependent oxidoreductase [bacterium]|nr:FAD-dependent oxidoreductase [bacterium]